MVTTNGLTDTYYGLSTDIKPTGEPVPSGGITPTGTITITKNDTYDVTQYASAEVNVSGGSSDYTTATITVTENGATNGIISAPIIIKAVTGHNEEVELTMGYIETGPHETCSYTIILSSSGISQIYIPPEKIDVISISGDIEDYTDGYYGITGDCAITVETILVD